MAFMDQAHANTMNKSHATLLSMNNTALRRPIMFVQNGEAGIEQ